MEGKIAIEYDNVGDPAYLLGFSVLRYGLGVLELGCTKTLEINIMTAPTLLIAGKVQQVWPIYPIGLAERPG